ncbi:MAG: nucleotidyltransferase domain-containing protein [Lachnospiraceae bacterium]|nr:nucleotidyltransferase domain-containing protein [Lachnospiraceae bacterium]
MKDLEIRNQKIIDAVIEKANRICPESLAMIGIYGSYETGDFYKKSDLDLLVLINDEKGWQLGCTFIQDDLEVGHDIYCTTWESLQKDALYNSPNISKLMDSKIVYYADKKYLEKLESLRKKANDILLAPFSREDYIKAENLMKEAEHFYVAAMFAEDMADIWVQAGCTLYYVENAIAMLNKKYFRYGVKRIYEELELMEKKPYKLCEMIETVLSGNSADQIKKCLTVLMQEAMHVFKKVETTVSVQKKPVSVDSVRGTYEEMFSNWRNKMYYASDKNNRHLAFMSMISLHDMFSELGDKMEIDSYHALDGYDPQNLRKTAQAFDDLIQEYLKEYQKVNLQVARYPDVDAFVTQYLK